MSTRPEMFRDGEPWKPLSHPHDDQAPPTDMSITVGENTARLTGVSRADADAWACRSHRRAVAAIDEGRFLPEVVPVGDFAIDEHPRRDTTIERLAALPVLHPELPGATVTAGNSAGLNDAASAVVLTSGAFARATGLVPLARVRSWASVGVDPVRTGLAPTLAIPLALERAGLRPADVALFEINEAFCSMAVACTRILGLDEELVNVNGSGCSLGHPIAATGARMVVSTIAELQRR
jgi:acetyl-CoA C-acetyltransferase